MTECKQRKIPDVVRRSWIGRRIGWLVDIDFVVDPDRSSIPDISKRQPRGAPSGDRGGPNRAGGGGLQSKRWGRSSKGDGGFRRRTACQTTRRRFLLHCGHLSPATGHCCRAERLFIILAVS